MVKNMLALLIVGLVVMCVAPVCAEEAVTESGSPDTSMQAQPASPSPADEEALPGEEGVGEGVVTGEVMNLDTTANSISVKGEDGAEKTFSVVDGETILWKGVEDIKLVDVKKGDKAEVGYYTDEKGMLIASWVDLIIPEEKAAPGADAPSAPAEATDIE